MNNIYTLSAGQGRAIGLSGDEGREQGAAHPRAGHRGPWAQLDLDRGSIRQARTPNGYISMHIDM